MKKLICVLMFSVSSSLAAEQILVSNFTESEYESIERVFSKNTGHIDNLEEFVLSNILSNQDLSKGSFLDIGAGPGTITDRLSKFFESTTVIEPNKEFEPIYRAKGFISYIGNFQDVKFGDQYDFVLCSHVLYHVSQDKWVPFLKKLYELIRPGCKGLILMVAPKGKWHALRASINMDCSTSRQVEKALKELNISYDLNPVQSVFVVDNHDDFRSLVRLFTIENCFLPDAYRTLSDSEKEQINQKIDDYILSCRQSDGSYEFFDEDVYITIHKE